MRETRFWRDQSFGTVPGLRSSSPSASLSSSSKLKQSKSIDPDSHILEPTASFAQSTLEKNDDIVLNRRNFEIFKGSIPGLRAEQQGTDEADHLSLSGGFYARSLNSTAGRSSPPPIPRSTSPASSSSAAAAASYLKRQNSVIADPSCTLESERTHQDSVLFSSSSSSSSALLTSTYSLVLPCVTEEREALAEKKRNMEALQRLRKRLEEERLRGQDPQYNDPEDDSPFLKTIFDAPQSSNSQSREGMGSGEQPSRDDSAGHEPSSRKVSSPVIPRRKNGSGNEGLLDLTCGITAVKHGRGGIPKTRRVLFDSESMEIRWKPDEKKVGIIGRLFTSNIIPASSMAPGIKLADIKSVVKGIHTDVLLRAKLVDPGSCVSLITDDRTLDLTLPSHSDRSDFIRSIKELLQTHLPDKSVAFA